MFLKAVIVVLLLMLASKYYSDRVGQSLHFKKHYPGDCRLVEGHDKYGGSEDMEVTSDGLAFITSGVAFKASSAGYKEYMKEHKLSGKIYLYDFKKPELGAQVLRIKASKTFDPNLFQAHGIAILEDKVKGQHLLYVVNHPEPDDDSVEKFRYIPETKELVHLKSITDPVFTTTNDLALTDEDTFYISNFLYGNTHLMEQIEVTLSLPLGCLVYYNGTGASCYTEGLVSPNGVTLSKDKKFIYVNLPVLRRMYVYKRNADNSVELVQDLMLHTSADNFHLSQKGDALFTGSHPIPHKMLAYLEDPNLKTPSSVLHLPLEKGLVVESGITEVFYDHGDLISASSNAAMYGRRMLIGSVLNSLVVCDIDIKV